MSGFEVFLAGNTALVIVLLVWAVWLAQHELKTERSARRVIHITYGPGYSLLQWREESLDWDWSPTDG